MKIKVLGKAHLEGVSKKTGKPYNFNQIHFLQPSQGVEGYAACTESLDPALFPLDSIVLNGTYDIQYNNRGYVVEFTPVK